MVSCVSSLGVVLPVDKSQTNVLIQTNYIYIPDKSLLLFVKYMSKVCVEKCKLLVVR